MSKRYANSQVLCGIDLDIVDGECFGLVGVNGAGKTSMLNCLLDFCGVDDGRIDIFGRSHRLPAARRPLAFLPERFMPPYYLSGRAFLRYVLALQGLRYDEAGAARLAAALDLEPAALPRPVRTYSKGMMQKLGLVACLLADKPLYVLDEPMSGLDPKARALLKQQLQRVRAAGATLFFTSHALADVEELCDRMAILHQGQLRFVGTPAACRAQFGAAGVGAAGVGAAGVGAAGAGAASLEQAFLHCIQ